MKAIIYFTMSKHQYSKKIAKDFEGDVFEIKKTSLHINFFPLQLVVFGFLANTNFRVDYAAPTVDYEKYDEIVLISPVWSGKLTPYMRQYLKDHPFKNKKVTLVASCNRLYKKYFKSYQPFLDDSNDIINEIVYIKGEKQGV